MIEETLKSGTFAQDEAGLCDWRDVGSDGDLLGLAGDAAMGAGGGSAAPDGCPAPTVDASPSLLLLPSCEFADCPNAVSRFTNLPRVSRLRN